MEDGTIQYPWLATYRRVARLAAEADRYRDTSLRPGEKRFWRVRVLGRDGREGPPSAPVRSQPPIVEDAVVSVLSEGEVEIAWEPDPEHRAWRVERADVEVWSEDQLTRMKARLRPGPIRRVWPFRVLGIDSGPSPSFLAIPGPVRSVFARECGQEVDLKWAPYAENGLRGYRVYVHDGHPLRTSGGMATIDP